MQRPRQLISERPGEHISPSAGAERDDDPEGTGGIVLGRRARTHGERNDGEDRGDEKSRHDLPPIFVFLWRIGRRPSRRKAHGNVWHDCIDLVACRLALLWQILSGTGFPNQFFCDSWVVGCWRGRPWLAGCRIGETSLNVGSCRF